MVDITVAIDKLDKIGMDKVKEELETKGLSAAQIQTIEQYLQISGTEEEKLSRAEALLGQDPEGAKGIEELRYLHSFSPGLLETDLTLARGLNYYTGTIFEVKAVGVQMGSIGGGGRYDDLTGLFGVNGVPGVGISFGVDRIYDVMEELGLMPNDITTCTKILFFNLGEAESRQCLKLMQELRENGIACELFHEKAKFDKQFKYAEKKNIPYVAILGEEELKTETVMLKNLAAGTQEKLLQKDLHKVM
jgi:histidyl-tRNA synthetase